MSFSTKGAYSGVFVKSTWASWDSQSARRQKLAPRRTGEEEEKPEEEILRIQWNTFLSSTCQPKRPPWNSSPRLTPKKFSWPSPGVKPGRMGNETISVTGTLVVLILFFFFYKKETILGEFGVSRELLDYL